jgi:hypothetical protein
MARPNPAVADYEVVTAPQGSFRLEKKYDTGQLRQRMATASYPPTSGSMAAIWQSSAEPVLIFDVPTASYQSGSLDFLEDVFLQMSVTNLNAADDLLAMPVSHLFNHIDIVVDGNIIDQKFPAELYWSHISRHPEAYKIAAAATFNTAAAAPFGLTTTPIAGAGTATWVLPIHSFFDQCQLFVQAITSRIQVKCYGAAPASVIQSGSTAVAGELELSDIQMVVRGIMLPDDDRQELFDMYREGSVRIPYAKEIPRDYDLGAINAGSSASRVILQAPGYVGCVRVGVQEANVAPDDALEFRGIRDLQVLAANNNPLNNGATNGALIKKMTAVEYPHSAWTSYAELGKVLLWCPSLDPGDLSTGVFNGLYNLGSTESIIVQADEAFAADAKLKCWFVQAWYVSVSKGRISYGSMTDNSSGLPAL